MTYRVIVLPEADAETLEAFAWLAERSPDAAARWLEGLKKSVFELARSPTIHPVAPVESEAFGVEIRQALYGRRRGIYRILFTIEADVIKVLAIRHAARGPTEP